MNSGTQPPNSDGIVWPRVNLQPVEFTEDLLNSPLVQNFDCGDTRSGKLAAEWLKVAPPFRGALRSMQDHHNRVWLYFLEDPFCGEKHLVGFSSLGQTRWPIPPPDGPPREVAFIPMLAVAKGFQRRPAIQPRYSHQIMDHLLSRAIELGHREVCLLVAPDNLSAVRLYEAYGFHRLGGTDKYGNHQMLKTLD